MNFSGKVPAMTRGAVRRVATLSLLVPSGCILLFVRGLPKDSVLPMLNYNILTACGILLLLTTGRKEDRLCFPVMVGEAAMLVLALVLYSCFRVGLREEMHLVFAVILTFPHCVLLTRSVLSDIRVVSSLAKRVSPWDFVHYAIKMTFFCYFLCLVALFTGFNCEDTDPQWTNYIFLVLGVVLFSLLMIRSLNSDSSLARGQPGEQELQKAVSGSGPENYKDLYKKIQEFMDEKKPYLRDTCQLDDIAQALCTNRSYISRVIGECSGTNFPRFINGYRVRYSMMLYMENSRLRVSELAVKSGFHSTVSYNMAFKAYTKKTPSEWCTEYRDSIRAEELAMRKALRPSVQEESSSQDGSG